MLVKLSDPVVAELVDEVLDESVSAAESGVRTAPEPVVEIADDDSAEVPSDEGFRPITSQAEFDAALKQRLERAQRSAEKKASSRVSELEAKLKEYEDAQLSADEKKDKRLAELEQSLNEATERYQQLERTRNVESLAREMGLPEKFWSRVQGSTDDEIISDINDMLEGLPKVERRDAVLSQAPRVSVQATNTDPEVEENPKMIVDKLNSMFSF